MHKQSKETGQKARQSSVHVVALEDVATKMDPSKRECAQSVSPWWFRCLRSKWYPLGSSCGIRKQLLLRTPKWKKWNGNKRHLASLGLRKTEESNWINRMTHHWANKFIIRTPPKQSIQRANIHHFTRIETHNHDKSHLLIIGSISGYACNCYRKPPPQKRNPIPPLLYCVENEERWASSRNRVLSTQNYHKRCSRA